MKMKLLNIFLLTGTIIGIAILMPNHLVEKLLLPALLGYIYSENSGETPLTSIDKILYIVILFTPLLGFLIIMPLSSSVAYLFGVLLHKFFRKLIYSKDFFQLD